MKTEIKLLLVTLIAAATAACNPKVNSNATDAATLGLGDTLACDKTAQWIQITSTGSWSITADYAAGSSGWCTLSQQSGSGSEENPYASVAVSVEPNSSTSERSVTFRVKFAKSTVELMMVQRGVAGEGAPNGGRFGGLLEMPAINADDSHLFVLHNVPDLSDKETNVRNFSLLYDTENRIPLWVAYPLHSFYCPSGNRTDAWQYDPKIPQNVQAAMPSGLGVSGYDRGHMLPSASRMYLHSNQQTFFYTNMTPQLSGFNQQKWANFESQVRGWKGTGSDTLYVVTGAVLRTVGGSETINYITNRNDGEKIAVPNYYYKALLYLNYNYLTGTKSYRAIAFWFAHRSATGQATAADAITVDRLEELTGIDMFVNLDQTVQQKVEASFDASQWGL